MVPRGEREIERERERENRLMSGVVRRERYCHWISDVGVKGQVNLGASRG